MAGTSLLTLIDDIATLLDDVSVMTKLAAKKTSGVLGDDLALNAQQVSGIEAAHEIPVILKVAKGSGINKIVLVPVALLLSYFVPVVITPLLVIGGLFLCFEGFEKVFEKLLSLFRPKFSEAQNLQKSKGQLPSNLLSSEGLKIVSTATPVLSEADRIKGAIRTDFILSAEIIVITLGTVSNQPLMQQFLVLTMISILMTFGVYGLVAGIVKLDDLGLWLNQQSSVGAQKFGRLILWFAPYLMKTLGVVGTIAMFLVGGGLITHSVPFLHSIQQNLSPSIAILFDGGIGFVAGGLVAGVIHLISSLFQAKQN